MISKIQEDVVAPISIAQANKVDVELDDCNDVRETGRQFLFQLPETEHLTCRDRTDRTNLYKIVGEPDLFVTRLFQSLRPGDHTSEQRHTQVTSLGTVRPSDLTDLV